MMKKYIFCSLFLVLGFPSFAQQINYRRLLLQAKQELASLQKKIQILHACLNDEDNDGVIDSIDQEPDTREGGTVTPLGLLQKDYWQFLDTATPIFGLSPSGVPDILLQEADTIRYLRLNDPRIIKLLKNRQ